MMIDTHCHLYVEEFIADRNEAMRRAVNAGVSKIYLPAIDSSTTEAMLELEAAYPGQCISMIGLHPCSVKENYKDELDHIHEWLTKRRFAAIGETGLDHYWDMTFAKEQEIALRIQAEWCLEFKLPIVLHTRNATIQTLHIVKEYVPHGLKGIFHCFGGTIEEAKEICDHGFLLGIGGVITYKNSGLAEVVAQLDLEHLVLETDAPYLSPVPYRGKRNEPAYLASVANKIAEVKEIAVEEVERVTTINAEEIFG